jgi:hypothetical protein
MAAEREVLDRELRGHPLRGKPLRRRYRNFSPDAAGYVASLGGPLPYMQRLRAIDDLVEGHLRRLEDAWRALAHECRRDPAGFERRWRATVERWGFYEVNDLIERHNRYFPAEARLPMDPRTGDFVRIDGRHYRKERLDAAWVLARFPPELPSALAA